MVCSLVHDACAYMFLMAGKEQNYDELMVRCHNCMHGQKGGPGMQVGVGEGCVLQESTGVSKNLGPTGSVFKRIRVLPKPLLKHFGF